LHLGVFIIVAIGIIASLLPSALASVPDPELANMMDVCPTPPTNASYAKTWSCGEWKIDHGELRRVFTLNVSEHKTYGIGNNESFQGWSYNNTIPGPTLRMTEGDPVTVYVANTDNPKFPHNFHMHSRHKSGFDGAGINPESHFIDQGTRGQYLFIASPAGVYPYHCHVNPVAQHISKGLFGMMIIDPKEAREPANETFLMMSAYDKDQDGINDRYVYNGVIDQYMHHPIVGKVGELQRIYLVNMIEYRDVMSFHLHGQMFNYWASGTTNSSVIYTDIVTLSQGDRGIIEFVNNFKCCDGSSENRNTFMFHPHQNDVSENGQMGFFDFP
jgi:FtsP/CotA-like multicopper oxidase with cupredoxin domain